MEKARAPALLGLFAMSAILAGPARAEELSPPHILFAVQEHARVLDTGASDPKTIRFLAEPIALISDGKLVHPPDGAESNHFAEDYYTPDHRYTLYSGGQPAGTVRVRESAFDIQCESMAASVDVRPAANIKGHRMGLATDHPFKPLGYTRRAASQEERAAAVAMANDVYAKEELDPAIAATAEATNVTVFDGPQLPLLIASFLVKEKEKPEDEYASKLHAVFLIAERDSDGHFRAIRTWFHSGEESGIQVQELVDVIDLDGTGSPSIITQFSYYESDDYHIYKRVNGWWSDVYDNFGSGC